MHKRGLCRHAVSARPSDTFVSCVKTNKHIFKFFSPSGSQAILVFLYQTVWQCSDGNPPNGGVKCRCGRQKTRFWTNIWLRCIQIYSVVNRAVANCEKQSRDGRWRASSTHRGVRRLLFAQDDDEVFVTGSTLYAGDEGRSPPPPGHNPLQIQMQIKFI